MGSNPMDSVKINTAINCAEGFFVSADRCVWQSLSWKMIALLSFMLSVAMLPGASSADVVDAQPIRVTDAWLRLLPPTVTTTALYFTVINESEHSIEIDRLEVVWAEHIELHETIHDQGMMQMVPLADTSVAAGQRLIFRRGAKHVMVMGLKEPVTESQKLSVMMYYRSSAPSNGGKLAVETSQGSISFEAEVKQAW